jgi:hypothetical protein
MVVSFENGADFYVKRNKAGLTVSDCAALREGGNG